MATAMATAMASPYPRRNTAASASRSAQVTASRIAQHRAEQRVFHRVLRRVRRGEGHGDDEVGGGEAEQAEHEELARPPGQQPLQHGDGALACVGAAGDLRRRRAARRRA